MTDPGIAPFSFNLIGYLFCGHEHWDVHASPRDGREYGGVHHAQPADTTHSARRVYNSARIISPANPAGARHMM
jgi:hypothetical protein